MRGRSARYTRLASFLGLAFGLGCETGGGGGAVPAASGAPGAGMSGGATPAGGNVAAGGSDAGTGGRATTTGGAPTAGGGVATTGGAPAAGGAPATNGGASARDGGGAPAATSGAAGNGASTSGAGTAGGSGGAVNGGRGGAGGTPGGAGAAGSWPSGDEFDGTALDASWTVFRPELADLALADGALSLTPKPKDLWYQASQGVLVYKLVTGDFKATATVHARKASDPSTPPAQFADVGGLLARNPSGNSENYVLGVVGYAEMDELAVEHKSTTDSQSEYGETAFDADAELRLCRSGATFTIYYRHPGDDGWPNSVAPIERSDLPMTLQVGLIAYTGASSPDYVSSFDRIAFEPVGDGCDQ